MARVVLKNIYKRFDNNTVVSDFNLEIEDREFIVFVGPSGCGKSTTLRMIAGLEEITEGEIYIGDRLVNDVAPKDRDIAMVFQNYALYPHMNVYDNMAFGLKLRKFARLEIEKRVQAAARILGLEELLKRKPKQLSGGQRQRVALGRAIVREPRVFLMDEPLSNLDAKLRVTMRTEIAKLHNRLQATMVYVTHDQIEAMTMGDRIVVLKDGFIQQVDTPQNLYDDPVNMFVAGFIGSPPMNFLTCRLIEEDGSLWCDGETFKVRIPNDKAIQQVRAYIGKDVVLGLRPADIEDKSVYIGEVNPDWVVRAQVDVVELMGSENNLYLSTGLNTITARVDPSSKARDGHTVELLFMMDKMHLFDPETEKTII